MANPIAPVLGNRSLVYPNMVGQKKQTPKAKTVADANSIGPEVWLIKKLSLIQSDAADEKVRVDLGGRRIIKKKNFLKQKTAYEIELGLVRSEMCIRDR